MTFDTIVSDICDRLNLTSAIAITRVGATINRVYKKVTTSIGLNVTRRTEVQANASIGSQFVTFSDIEKVISVIDRSSGQNRFLKDVMVDELDRRPTITGDAPTHYAIYRSNGTTVVIKTNAIAQTAYTLYAPGIITVSTLTGTDAPAFSESYHDILVEGVLYEEYLKAEKPQLAMIAKSNYEDRLGDLRLFIAKSPQQDIYQGKMQRGVLSGASSSASGGGSTPNGATSYTQTGLITFDRTGAAVGSRFPFAVTSGSEKIANLDADLLDGLDSASFALQTDFASHHTRHESGGADAIKIDNLAAPDDNTDLNVSSTAHGLTPKSPNDTAKMFRGDASWAVAFPQITQGRLTLTSGTSVTTADVTGATSLYFTPYGGNRIALYTSAQWKLYTFSELTLALGTLTSGRPYDVFIYDNAGVLTLESLAWTSDTARATALVLQDGVLVKSGATNRKYLGTFRTTSTTATEDSLAKRFVWNYYNRVSRPLSRITTDASWSYSSITIRQANANTANQVEIVVGVLEQPITLTLVAGVSQATATALLTAGIGQDSTSAFWTSTLGGGVELIASDDISMVIVQVTAFPSSIGRHFYAWLEKNNSAAATTTWYGTALGNIGLTGWVTG